MSQTNRDTGTRIDEIGDGIYRINTPVREIPGGFSFNQILVDVYAGPYGVRARLMAVYWNLGLCARTSADADACIVFFRKRRLVLDDVEVALEVHCSERADEWLVGVWPRGMSHGSPSGSDPRLTTDDAHARIARIFDQWLREAPPFRAAFFGGEAFDFFLDDAESIDAEGIRGLVIDEAMWVSLGRPPSAEPAGPGRFAWPRTA